MTTGRVVFQFDNVSKTYGQVPVVDSVSLAVDSGQYVGLLGPNGAGKSTIISMLLGLVQPDPGGYITLFGTPLSPHNAHRLRQRIGVVGEGPSLQDNRTVHAYLSFFAGVYGLLDPIGRIERRLHELNLSGAARYPIRTLSRGMKQRLSLARALLHDPDLLILDEPINGLDPRGVQQVRALLQRENQLGRTIFLSSHVLSEVERSCRTVAVLNRGKLTAVGATETLGDGDLERKFLELTGGG